MLYSQRVYTKGNSVGKTASEVDRAYIAGLIDGDGAIMALIERHAEKRFGFRVRVALKVTQYARQDVEWLVEATGAGAVCPNRTCFDWLVRNQADVLRVLDVITPYLRGKTRQAEIARQILQRQVITKEDLYEIAQLADTLSSFNIRSKNRRKNFATMVQEDVSRND